MWGQRCFGVLLMLCGGFCAWLAAPALPGSDDGGAALVPLALGFWMLTTRQSILSAGPDAAPVSVSAALVSGFRPHRQRKGCHTMTLCLTPPRTGLFRSLAACAAAALSRFAAVSEKDAAPVRAEVNRRAERLLDTYGNAILRYAYSFLHNQSDAEEILQDTLLQFLKTAPVFHSAQHEKAWLLRVAGNLSRNRLQYNAVRSTDELKEELAAEDREDLSFVWDAVSSLPEPERAAVHLFYYEGLSTREIAGILSQKESTVRSHLHRARGHLKEILKEAYDF